MSRKELDRLEAVQHVVAKRLTQSQAGDDLGISARQVRRLVRRYRSEGRSGLISRRRGKPGNNRLGNDLRDRAVALVRDHYADFGPTLAHEKLDQLHQLKVSRESLRQWMMGAGLWKAKRRREKRLFPLRERRARFGELVQIDGSPHDWFEGRSEPCTLLVFIDDATGRLLYLRFVPAETTAAYLEALKDYLRAWGRPVALYSDRHSIFRINTEEPLRGNGLTQFGRALETLDIEGIQASTPQAKGRVERVHQTLQDRLVKEMRLRRINTHDEGNAFLGEYMRMHNERFAVAPRSPEDAHRTVLHSEREIELILAHQEQRRLSKNLTCQYDNTVYQIDCPQQKYTLRNARVTVCKLPARDIVILHQGAALSYRALKKGERPSPVEDEKNLNQRVDTACKAQARRRTWKPAPDHPWRKPFLSNPGSRAADPGRRPGHKDRKRRAG
jgi:hypothetical protein